jgi:hypothetical protein
MKYGSKKINTKTEMYLFCLVVNVVSISGGCTSIDDKGEIISTLEGYRMV